MRTKCLVPTRAKRIQTKQKSNSIFRNFRARLRCIQPSTTNASNLVKIKRLNNSVRVSVQNKWFSEIRHLTLCNWWMVLWISYNGDENKRNHHENVSQRAFNTKTIYIDHLLRAFRVHIQCVGAIINQCTKSGSFLSLVVTRYVIASVCVFYFNKSSNGFFLRFVFDGPKDIRRIAVGAVLTIKRSQNFFYYYSDLSKQMKVRMLDLVNVLWK